MLLQKLKHTLALAFKKAMDQFKELFPKMWVVQLTQMEDLRGSFVKTISRTLLDKLDCKFDLMEEYYSVSTKDVIRGMHFQIPPYDHIKIISCMAGSVMDVLLDLRPGRTYGKSYSLILSASAPCLLIIPKGVAHGFRSLTENSILMYRVSSEYSSGHDSGVLWNSFDFDWKLTDPILSERDRLHPTLKDFQTPFAAS